MTALAGDHLQLLALARRVIEAETGPLWTESPIAACERHGAACDAFWSELRRQVDAQAGAVPVLEHPSVIQRKLAYRMRREIVSIVNNAIEDALDNMDFTDTDRAG
jgi:hypothetical protein